MNSGLIHVRFIMRQLISSRKQALLFMSCVALAIVTLVSLNAFSVSVQTSLRKDARTLHAADILIDSRYALSTSVVNAVERLEQAGEAKGARIWEFYSMVRPSDGHDALLAKLKVVEKGYPFYGKVVLKSGREFGRVLKKGRIAAAQALLDRLQIQVGDWLQIGNATLQVSDIVLTEPDQPVDFFFLGPRIFVSAADLEAIGLLTTKSRVRYSYLIKVSDPANIDEIAGRLQAMADEDLERVDTYRTARSGVKRFFDNLLFFLSLIGIFTLLLAGFGIQSSLAAFLKENEITIAIIKIIGARGNFFIRQYIAIVTVLGAGGTILGLAGGFLMQYALNYLFEGLLPHNVQLRIAPLTVFQGLGLGFLVVGLYSFLPLYRLKGIKPMTVFRKEPFFVRKGWPFYLPAVLILLLLMLPVFRLAGGLKTGIYFVLGVMLLLLITAALAGTVLYFLKQLKIKNLTVRQAIRGLYRPKNTTRSIIVTLTASLAVIFAIHQIERNLDAAFVQSYPKDAPNLFFLDILPDQMDRFADTLDMKAQYYPIVRARILTINGEKIDRRQERGRRGDNLARTFNLTYRDHLLDDEKIIKGKQLFNAAWDDLQVSVMDTVAHIQPMEIGDRITFNIQGIPLQARISSIRTRTHDSIRPFFYFVFPENALRDAPQTIFTAVRVPRDRIPAIQTRITAKFPNISAIDVTETLSRFTVVITKLSLIIQFFSLFSMTAGILIMLSSVLATRFARIQEAVYYRVLGAGSMFVAGVFSLENIFLGLLSATLALALSQTGSWIICSRVLDIHYKPFFAESFGLVAATVLLVAAIGLLPSISILRQKPVVFLRHHNPE